MTIKLFLSCNVFWQICKFKFLSFEFPFVCNKATKMIKELVYDRLFHTSLYRTTAMLVSLTTWYRTTSKLSNKRIRRSRYQSKRSTEKLSGSKSCWKQPTKWPCWQNMFSELFSRREQFFLKSDVTFEFLTVKMLPLSIFRFTRPLLNNWRIYI